MLWNKMVPRILMLMNGEQYFQLQPLQRTSPCTFVRYDRDLTPNVIGNYLDNHRQDFDSVAVLSGRENEIIRLILNEHFSGPKILFDFDGQTPTNTEYTKITCPVRISDFERTVREAFAALR